MADKVKHIAIENSGGTTNYDIYDENSYVEIGKVDNKITNINNKIGTDNIGNKTITKAIKDLQESSTSAGVKTVDNIQPDSNGNIDLSDKYLKQKHEEKQGNTLEIGHVKLTDTLPAGVPDAQVNGVETVTAASGYAVQKVREDLTTKITEVSNKIPENIGTVISVNGQKPNNAGAVIVTGSDIDYKTFLSGEVSSSIADKFEEIDNKLLYSQKIAPILTEDFSPAIRYIEIKGLTFGDGDEAVNYKFASDVAANPSVEANPPVLNSITINGVDYAIKGGEGGGGQTIQVSTLPEASIGYLDETIIITETALAAYQPKDWRAELYLRGLVKQSQQIRPDVYEQELLDLFDDIYDFKNECFKTDLTLHPNDLTYFFDFIEPADDMYDYSVDLIGTRIHSYQQEKIRRLYNTDIPNVIIINMDDDNADKIIKKCALVGQTFSRVTESVAKNISLGTWGYTAQEVMRNLLYQYTSMRESISLNAIPIYHLDVNNRITVQDRFSKIFGDYIVQSISLPLGGNGNMSITASRALDRI